MSNSKKNTTPRVRVIQKLYGNSLNPEAVIEYPKSQYKKFIKDVVQGTIERNDLISETVTKHLEDDLDLKRTDKLLKIIIFAAIFELLYKHNNPTKVIINEYVKTSE
jgi:N utilization substance protein B